MKLNDKKEQWVDPKLNATCFLLPNVLALPAYTYTESNLGLMGFLVSLFGALFSAYILIFRPSRRIKQAAWSNILGFSVSIAIFLAGAYMVWNGSPSSHL